MTDIHDGMPTLGRAARDLIGSMMTHPPDYEVEFMPGRECINICIDADNIVTDEAEQILDALPEILERFFMKNRKYAKVQRIDLGAAGIIPDLNRKTGVLIDRIWEGSESVDESTVEVIDDLIGHLLLLRTKLEPTMETADEADSA